MLSFRCSQGRKAGNDGEDAALIKEPQTYPDLKTDRMQSEYKAGRTLPFAGLCEKNTKLDSTRAGKKIPLQAGSRMSSFADIRALGHFHFDMPDVFDMPDRSDIQRLRQ